MDKNLEKHIKLLFEHSLGKHADKILELPSSGSYRQYYRLKCDYNSIIAAYNNDLKENAAFIAFTKHFFKYNLPVPEIYAVDESNYIYLLEDLGDITLFSWLSENRVQQDFSDEIVNIYKKIIDFLPLFQIESSSDFDYKNCYPRAMFDKQSMLWDLSYFKYYFLKLAKINFNEQNLEDDFHEFSEFLLTADCNFFLYRDFQSRNIMLRDKKPYFIDYQGGRKGALQYDIASLLYDAKADIPQDTRTLLLDYYIKVAEKYTTVDYKNFISYYNGYVLIRIMQALGAYGFRGFYENKSHFLQSIPYALDNLKWLLENSEIPCKIPTLKNILSEISYSEKLHQLGKQKHKLKITITSFSYKNRIPTDNSGNGGGFVFDCRALHNPGKYEEYKTLTGKDKEVIDFLRKESDIYEFMNHVYGLVEKTAENYFKRNFTHLQVNFGCTGGQHRSVFCANMLFEHLKKKFDVELTIHHTELEKQIN